MDEDLELSLTPPNHWRALQLDPQFRKVQIDDQIAALKHVMADWSAIAPSLRRFLKRSYALAWQAGVRYAITAGPDPDGLVNIMATYMLAVLPSSTADGEHQLDGIVDNLSDQRDSLLEGERQDLSRIVVPEVGEAIQSAEIRFVPDEHANLTSTAIAQLRIFIPWRNRVIVATGVTPQVEIADTMFQLFANITNTLRIRRVPALPLPPEQDSHGIDGRR